MKVRGDYVVSTSKTDDALRLISTASFDIWPQNRWGPSNFQSFSLQRLQFHELSRLVEWDLQKTVPAAHFFHDALKFVAFNFTSKDAEHRMPRFGSNKKYLNICAQYRSPQDFNILQHTSTIFNPKLNLKTHPVGAAQSFKIVGERHPNNRQESATTTVYYCI